MITNGFEALSFLDAEAEVNIKVSNNDSQDSSEDITEDIDKVEENVATDDKKENDVSTEIENVEATMKYMSTLLAQTSLFYQIMNVANTTGISKTLYNYLEKSFDINSIFKNYKLKVPSVENFNSYSNSEFVSATESALQTVKQKLVNIGKAIYKFIKNIFSKIANLFKSHKTKIDEAIKIIKESDKTPEFTDDKYKEIKVLKFEKSKQLMESLNNFMTYDGEIKGALLKFNEAIKNETGELSIAGSDTAGVSGVLSKFKIDQDEDLEPISKSTDWKQQSNMLQALETLNKILDHIDTLKNIQAVLESTCKKIVNEINDIDDDKKAALLNQNIKTMKALISGLISSSNKIITEHIKIAQLYINDIKKEKKENTDNLE